MSRIGKGLNIHIRNGIRSILGINRVIASANTFIYSFKPFFHRIRRKLVERLESDAVIIKNRNRNLFDSPMVHTCFKIFFWIRNTCIKQNLEIAQKNK